jgi:PAS domain S-box-containing protein
MLNKRPRHQESAQPIRNEIMNRPQNPELHQKQALSLHRAYILVGVVGAVMLVFILNNYLNSKRLNELTSPLWTAIREVELEATAVQHEATDLLRGEIEPAAGTLWFYLDQSIWHLVNLLESHQKSSRSRLTTRKLDFEGRIEIIGEHLTQLKQFFQTHRGQGKTDEAVTDIVMRFEELFAAFRYQLQEMEGDVSGLMDKEQLQQRIFHGVLVVFCVLMIGLVGYQIRRYERYRKKNYEAMNTANLLLARQIDERERAESALKERERLFRTMFDTSPDAIMLSRLTDDVIVDVNRAFTEFTGYAKNELIGKTPGDMPRWKDFNLRDWYTASLESGRPVHNAEFRITMKDGQVRTALVSANTVDFGQAMHLVTAGRDISDLKKDIAIRKLAEQKLRVSYEFIKIANDNRQIGQMLSQFSAVIKTHTGCSKCTIRLLGDDDLFHDAAFSDRTAMRCGLDPSLPVPNRSMCVRVANGDVDATRPWFTDFGSYFLDPVMADGAEHGQGPEYCEEHRCRQREYRSVALVPIKVGDQILGLIHVADTREGLLDQEMVEIMETAAMHVGTAIRRLRAEKGLETAYHEMERRVAERTRELSRMNTDLQIEIEERRQIEVRLRKNRNTLQTVIDGLSDSLILVDRDMRIRMINRAAVNTYQIESLDNVIGNLCYHEIGNIGDCEDCTIPLAVQRGEIVTFERQALADADRLERVTIFPVAETDDSSGGAIIRISDITEEKRFEQQLVQSEKMASLGILVSSIGHEINNPNNFITFNIPILREYLEALIRISDQYADSQSDLELFHMSYGEFRQDVFKLVDNIEHGASRISKFVSNLRDFSQGNGDREKVWLELPVVVEKVLSICRSKIKRGVRHFEVDIPTGQPRIYADEYSLEQVLLNLIVNAVQSMDKADAAVRLSASTGDAWQDTTIIKVSDNGCGMDEEKLGQIFNPFFTTKSASEGTGLGLYVCHSLVQRLGGRIEVDTKKGEGSTFTVILPDRDRRSKTRS